MTAMNDVQPTLLPEHTLQSSAFKTRDLLFAVGLLMLAAVSLQAAHDTIQDDGLPAPDAVSASEDLKESGGSASYAPPIAPAMQKRFLR